MKKQQTFRATSGHEIVPISLAPVEVFTESEMDYIDPGKIVTGTDSTRYKITEVRHIAGRLYKVVLLPLPEACHG